MINISVGKACISPQGDGCSYPYPSLICDWPGLCRNDTSWYWAYSGTTRPLIHQYAPRMTEMQKEVNQYGAHITIFWLSEVIDMITEVDSAPLVCALTGERWFDEVKKKCYEAIAIFGDQAVIDWDI